MKITGYCYHSVNVWPRVITLSDAYCISNKTDLETNNYILNSFFAMMCLKLAKSWFSSRIFQWNITTSGLVSGTSLERSRTGDLARPWRPTGRGSSSSAEKRPTPTVRRGQEQSIGLQGENHFFCGKVAIFNHIGHKSTLAVPGKIHKRYGSPWNYFPIKPDLIIPN